MIFYSLESIKDTSVDIDCVQYNIGFVISERVYKI